MGGEVFLHLLGLGNHGILPLLTVWRANLSLVHRDELKGLENSLGLVYRAANGEVVSEIYHSWRISDIVRSVVSNAC